LVERFVLGVRRVELNTPFFPESAEEKDQDADSDYSEIRQIFSVKQR
jgi:hypothetical protein